ncbi:MAG: response regulator [Desulfobacterota bacterium]|nr:response regulator [Thermodesulfobacteriota bacterium]
MKEKILIVDDDKYITLLLFNFLEDEGYVCDTAENGLEALEKISKGATYDLVLLDFVMPKMNGLEFLAAVKEINPKLPVLMISGYRTRDNTLEALRLGAIGFIKKPFSLNDVLKNLRLVLNTSKSKKELGPILPYLKRGHMEFIFKTGEISSDKVSLYLATHLGEMGFIEGYRISTVALAFNEVLTNAIEHGNLELPVNYFTNNGETNDKESLIDLKNQRLKDPQFADRNIIVRYAFENNETQVTIRDEGKGFDTSKVTRFLEQDSTAVTDDIGRGLLLVKYAVDYVRFNEQGNEVTLVIRNTA